MSGPVSEKSYDAVVIGGGIVGCSSAYFLAREGLRIALVERDSIGCGTTSNSFAWINATSKVADEPYHRLNALGQATYRELAVEFGEENLGLNPSGMLQWVRRSDDSGYQSMSQQADKLKSFGYPCRWLDVGELRALEPHIVFEDDVEALYAMADPCLDAPRYARFMADQLTVMGSSVFEGCPAIELEMTDEGTITGVVTGAGTLKTEKVLVTTGPGTPEVLSELTGYDGFASRFPMNRVPGLLVSTPSTAPMQFVRHVIYTLSGDAFHILPLPNGGLKIGADDTDGAAAEDPSPERLRALGIELLRRAQRMIPRFVGEACIDDCHLGIGVRPYPQDGKSMAGALPGAEGLYVIATHSGVTLSPILGKLMTQLMVTGETPDTLAPFALDRFQAFA